MSALVPSPFAPNGPAYKAAGSFQRFGTVAAHQVQNAETGAEALLRVRFASARSARSALPSSVQCQPPRDRSAQRSIRYVVGGLGACAPASWYAAPGRRHSLRGGRLHLGISDRHHIEIPGRLAPEYARCSIRCGQQPSHLSSSHRSPENSHFSVWQLVISRNNYGTAQDGNGPARLKGRTP